MTTSQVVSVSPVLLQLMAPQPRVMTSSGLWYTDAAAAAALIPNLENQTDPGGNRSVDRFTRRYSWQLAGAAQLKKSPQRNFFFTSGKEVGGAILVGRVRDDEQECDVSGRCADVASHRSITQHHQQLQRWKWRSCELLPVDDVSELFSVAETVILDAHERGHLRIFETVILDAHDRGNISEYLWLLYFPLVTCSDGRWLAADIWEQVYYVEH